MCTIFVPGGHRGQRSVGSPRTRATEVSEPPCECWESTWIFCKKQQAFSYPLSYFTRPPLKLFVNGKNKQFMYDKHLCFSVHQATTSPGEERKLTLLHISYRYICILSFQLFKDDKDISNSNLNPKPLQFHCRFTERSLMSNV